MENKKLVYGFLAIAAAALVITTAASIVPTQTSSTSNVTQSEPELSAPQVNVKELLSISPEYEYVLLSSAYDGQAEGCVCLKGTGTIQGYKYNVSSGEFELKGTRELVGHTQCFEYQGHCAIVYPGSVSVVSHIESGSDCAPGALNLGAQAVGVGEDYRTYDLSSGHWGLATGCVCLKGTGKVESYYYEGVDIGERKHEKRKAFI